jgi:proline iminopeptidase
MTEAKLAPNLPGWMVDHANRYLSSGGTDGHMYKMTQPGRPEMSVPSDVEVQVGTSKMPARARTASGEERARLWEKSLEFWPPYADYQRKTEREIPVVVLDPVK